jgi:hypothetical protein
MLYALMTLVLVTTLCSGCTGITQAFADLAGCPNYYGADHDCHAKAVKP